MKRFCFLPLVLGVLSGILAQSALGAAGDPWLRWARNPLTIPVTIEATDIVALTNTIVSISLADAQIIQAGASVDCAEDMVTNAVPQIANLQARREYSLTVVASNLSKASLHLSFNPTWSPITRRGRTGQPKTYRLLVDHTLSATNVVQVEPGGCGYYSNRWRIELTERIPANWRLEDGSDDASRMAGDAPWAEIGPGKSADPRRGAISWQVSLGRLMDGTSAGSLTLRESAITRDIYTLTNLYYTAASGLVRDQVELVTLGAASPVLRQVKGYQTFVDIVPVNTNQTDLRFYHTNQVGTGRNTNGYYTNLTGSAFVTWTLLNPNSANTNSLYIIETRHADGPTNSPANPPNATNQITCGTAGTSGTWTLRYGSAGEERVETRTVTVTGSSPNAVRTEVVDVRYQGLASPAYRATEIYGQFAWGFELTGIQIDPDGNPATADDLVTICTFYSDSVNDPAMSYGKPKAILYPDGYWEKRVYADEFTTDQYPGALYRIYSPLGDGPAGGPGDATPENSTFQEYCYDLTNGTVKYVDTVAGGVIIRRQACWREESGSGTELSYDVTDGIITGPNGIDIGYEAVSPDETWGYGSFGHKYYERRTGDYLRYYVFHGGTYDPVQEQFTLSGQDLENGPDWRMTTIVTGPGYISDDPLAITEIESEAIDAGEYSPCCCHTNRSWRENTIYRNGNLVQREKYVFTGMDGNGEPQFSFVSRWVSRNDSLGHNTNIALVWTNAGQPARRTLYSASYTNSSGADGELLRWEVDETGTRTSYTYDTLKRVRTKVKEGAPAAVPAQPPITTQLAYDAVGQVVSETTSAGGISLTSSRAYDAAKRVTSEVSTNGLSTTTLYELGGRRKTTVLPSTRTVVEEKYRDRRLKSQTGTGIVNEFHEWTPVDGTNEVSWESVVLLDTVHYGTANSQRVQTEGLDRHERVVRTEKPDWGDHPPILECRDYFTPIESNPGAIRRSGGSSLRAMEAFLYDLDSHSTARHTVFPTGQGESQEPDSSSRITDTIREFQQDATGAWLWATTEQTYLKTNDATPTLIEKTWERLNGFAATNIASQVTKWDADGNPTVTTRTVDRGTKTVTEVTVVTNSVLSVTRVTVNGLLQSENSPTVAQPTRYGYDALGRQTSVTNSVGAWSRTDYSSVGQVTNVVDFTGLTTGYEYYGQGSNGAGEVRCEIQGGTKRTYKSYTDRGEPSAEWGEVPYPKQTVYDIYGQPKALYTFQGGTGWNNADWNAINKGTTNQTTWTYEDKSGLLLSKTDAKTNKVDFTYSQGLLKTRKWARGVTTTNLYNDLGELTAIDYSDGTPSVAYTNGVTDFNRRGQPQMVSDASGIWRMEYDYAGRLTAMACTNGAFNGITLSNRYNPVFGRDRVLAKGTSWSIDSIYGFDTCGRLSTVTRGSESVSYGYLANSDLLSQTTNSSGGPVLTTTRTWDYGSRLRSIANTTNGVAVASYAYTYDGLGRPTQSTLADGSWWNYGYDDRDEVVSGKRFWSDFSAVAGQQFEYGFDNIGNRTVCKEGGDRDGLNLRSEGYGCDSVNQYTSRTNSDQVDIVGAASPLATVTVRGAATARRGEYYDCPLTVGNPSTPVALLITNIATLGGNTAAVTGSMLVPPKTQSFAYDLDGNLTGDGLWTYTWDAENRLKSAETSASLGNWARCRLDMVYDFQGRRVAKTVRTNWTGSAYQGTNTTCFVYDGWNLIGELNAAGSPIRSYVWGQDLSGTTDGAGGIGGLLMVKDHSDGATHFPAYDGNANVVALLRTDKTVTARYEYGPFGELIRASKPFAKANPFRFSTKYYDQETDLLYFGQRYYSPSLGRFISPDPIGTEGGLNLYAFVGNNPINDVDPVGASVLALDEEMAVGLGVALASTALVSGDAVKRMAQSLAFAVSTSQALLSNALDSDNVDVALAYDSAFRELNAERVTMSASISDKLIDRIDEHIGKLAGATSGGFPDPNDPNRNHWKKEIKAFLHGARQKLKNLPNNKLKREPWENAIKRGEEALKQYGD